MIEEPIIICLCGSTRFGKAFEKANFDLTLQGKIVLSIGITARSDDELFAKIPVTERIAIKKKLDELHLRKIDLADEVLILNVGGYIGESTANELEYARTQNKSITFLEEPNDS